MHSKKGASQKTRKIWEACYDVVRRGVVVVIDTGNPRISLFRWASFRDWSIARQSECRITWIIYVALSAGSSSFGLSDHITFEPIHPLPVERGTSFAYIHPYPMPFPATPFPLFPLAHHFTYIPMSVYTRDSPCQNSWSWLPDSYSGTVMIVSWKFLFT